MKKAISILLSLTLAFSLAACTTTSTHNSETNVSVDVSAEENAAPQEEEELSWHYETQMEGKKGEYNAEDGAVVMATSFDLPYLSVICNVEGVEAEAPDYMKKTVEAFNSASDQMMDRLIEEANGYAADAKEMYESLEESKRADFEPWTEEVTLGDVRSSDRLCSILLNGYLNIGGPHPTNFNSVFNFDLDDAKSVKLSDLTDDPAALNAAVAEEIITQIKANNLEEEFYENYAETLRGMQEFTVMFNGVDAVTVLLGEYELAPHAVGLPSFDVNYSVLTPHLNDYGKALLA